VAAVALVVGVVSEVALGVVSAGEGLQVTGDPAGLCSARTERS